MTEDEESENVCDYCVVDIASDHVVYDYHGHEHQLQDSFVYGGGCYQ